MNARQGDRHDRGEMTSTRTTVNAGQSSNDVFPSAVHLAALDRAVHDLHLRSSSSLTRSREGEEFDDVIQVRAHPPDGRGARDARPGFAGYGAQIRQGIARVSDALPRLGQIPLGGTATGTGLNTHPEFAEKVRAPPRGDGTPISPPADPFESQAARDGLVETPGRSRSSPSR